ncbi:MAG: outer membrane beta-barrel protein [Micropepsaceae bacterium]
MIAPRRLGRAASAIAAIAAILSVAYADGIAVMERPRPDYDAKGIPLGAFRLYPSVVLKLNTSNNVFQSDSARKGDINFEIAPAFELKSQWSQHALEVFGRLDALRFADHSSENLTDWTVGANGRLDVRRGSAAFAGISKSMAHEGRSSPNSPGNIAEPVQYSRFHAQASVAVQPNRTSFFFGGEFDRYSYDATPLNGGGVLSNRDRDRDEWRMRARASHEIEEGYFAFAEAEYERRAFDLETDRTGADRDSHGTALRGGLEFKLSALLEGEVFVGYRNRKFGGTLRDYSGVDYGAKLQWSVTQLTTVNVGASRTLNETTVLASSVSIDDAFRIGIDHELRRNVIVQANLSRIDSEFAGTSRDDATLEAHVGVTYLFDHNLRATAGYDRLDRDSNAPGEDFTEDKFNVGLHYQL